jgi:hypothetical protein
MLFDCRKLLLAVRGIGPESEAEDVRFPWAQSDKTGREVKSCRRRAWQADPSCRIHLRLLGSCSSVSFGNNAWSSSFSKARRILAPTRDGSVLIRTPMVAPMNQLHHHEVRSARPARPGLSAKATSDAMAVQGQSTMDRLENLVLHQFASRSVHPIAPSHQGNGH